MAQTALENSRCPKCGVEFRCGVTAGDNTCWCMGLPVLAPASSASIAQGACYCAKCLRELLAKQAT